MNKLLAMVALFALAGPALAQEDDFPPPAEMAKTQGQSPSPAMDSTLLQAQVKEAVSLREMQRDMSAGRAVVLAGQVADLRRQLVERSKQLADAKKQLESTQKELQDLKSAKAAPKAGAKAKP